MKLQVRHQTIYHYEDGAPRTAMRLKLMPRSHEGQQVEWWTVSVNGMPVDRFAPNGHGDMEALWIGNERMDSVTIIAEGQVETRDMAGIVRGLPPGADPLVYLRDTPLTEATPAITQAATQIEESDPLSLLHKLSALANARVAYRAGVTKATTTAGEAFEHGVGVCQDHAQIFIAMARLRGIPARYVSGYMLKENGEGEYHETHAWAEARVPALGWVGFDISNSVCVTDRYIRLACGLDARDAAPTISSAVGIGSIRIDADVRIDQSETVQGTEHLKRAQEQRQQ